MHTALATSPAHLPPVQVGTARRVDRERRSRRPVSAGTYRRRRAVVGILLAVPVAAGIVAAHDVLVGPGGDPASAAEGRSAPGPAQVTARPGDTLWSIAEQHRGEVAIGRYVDAMVALNGGPSIQAGQAVLLP